MKKYIQIFTLVIVLIFSLKFFQNTPFETLFFQIQAIFLGFILIFLVLYMGSYLFNKEHPNAVVWYFLILIMIIPLYSAYRASMEFGQPFVYGFLSERGWLIIGVGVWLYAVLIKEKMTIATVESTFVIMAWASLLFFSVFILIFDPNQLQGGAYGESKMISATQDRGLRFKFQLYFITFGSIYYFVKYTINRNPKDIVLLLAFLAYVIFVVQGRTYMIFLGTTFLLYFWFNFSIDRLIPVVIKLIFLIFLSALFMQALMPDYIDRMSHLFVQMFEVLKGRESLDASANSRIFQSEIVYKYFERNPLSIFLGTGSISNQWHNGYNSIFGRFYPSDIGLLGGLFVYGIIGMIFLCLIPMIVTIRTIRLLSEENNVFIITLKYLLIYMLLKFVQGSFYFGVTGYIIPLFILLAYIKLREGVEY
ncbi:hypothetical protein MNBD_GAMMA03-392 [hydrothermal vent metagenome]|uniref:Oligosaccharide repeat unit polymerase Wzy O-antigen ligase n=1 Tax=hydrothermal vent metagenome TaxID=652676 RepID=A0A3B0VZA4_9ZZZZ